MMTAKEVERDIMRFKAYLEANGVQVHVIAVQTDVASGASGHPELIREMTIQLLANGLGLKAVPK